MLQHYQHTFDLISHLELNLIQTQRSILKDEVHPSPACVNGCIYQEADNPSSYACFIEVFNEAECSVEAEQQGDFSSSSSR